MTNLIRRLDSKGVHVIQLVDGLLISWGHTELRLKGFIIVIINLYYSTAEFQVLTPRV